MTRNALGRLGSGFSLAALVLAATGCAGLRLHNPERLEQAKKARDHFAAAALDKTIEGERERQVEVLEDELELVREHTLARRDARLLYVIGERKSDKAWKFLESEIKSRVGELGLTMEKLTEHLKSQAMADRNLDALLRRAQAWEAQRKQTPGLPVLECPPDAEFDRESLTESQLADYDLYNRFCKTYLKHREGSLENRPVNRDLIDEVRAARKAAETEVGKKLKAYRDAKKAYEKALEGAPCKSEEGPTTDEEKKSCEAEKRLAAAAKELQNLVDKVTDLDKVKSAKEKLGGLGLGGAVSDLSAIATSTLVDAKQDAVLETLSVALETDTAKSWLAPKLEGKGKEVAVAKSLAALGSALATAPKRSLRSMLLEVEQLELDRKAAKKRLAFFERMLDLLSDKEAAYRAELVYLAKANRLRKEIRGELGDPPAPPACPVDLAAHDLFATAPAADERSGNGVDEECRDRVFRLLVNYSSSWALGRVEQEVADYRLIALHHEAALDGNEIAFARWQSLLGISIDQLVALEETGIKARTLSDIGTALGLGAIAVGVQ